MGSEDSIDGVINCRMHDRKTTGGMDGRGLGARSANNFQKDAVPLNDWIVRLNSWNRQQCVAMSAGWAPISHTSSAGKASAENHQNHQCLLHVFFPFVFVVMECMRDSCFRFTAILLDS